MKRILAVLASGAVALAIATGANQAARAKVDPAQIEKWTTEGNSNSGHDYGTNLSAEQKRELMEYLKTL